MTMTIETQIKTILNDETHAIHEIVSFSDMQRELLTDSARQLDTLNAGTFEDESAFMCVNRLSAIARLLEDNALISAIARADAVALYLFDADLTVGEAALVANIDIRSMRNLISLTKIEIKKSDNKRVTISSAALREFMSTRNQKIARATRASRAAQKRIEQAEKLEARARKLRAAAE